MFGMSQFNSFSVLYLGKGFVLKQTSVIMERLLKVFFFKYCTDAGGCRIAAMAPIFM